MNAAFKRQYFSQENSTHLESFGLNFNAAEDVSGYNKTRKECSPTSIVCPKMNLFLANQNPGPALWIYES